MKIRGSLRVGLWVWLALIVAACASLPSEENASYGEFPSTYDSDTALAYVSAGGASWWLTSAVQFDDDIFLDRFELSDEVSPPELAFTSPEHGDLLGTSRPELSLVFVDQGGGVDTDSLNFSVDSEPAEFDCQFSGLEADCVPKEPLDDGPRQIAATVSDFKGQTSSPAVLEILIDTWIPPSLDPDWIQVEELDGQLSVSGQLEELQPGTRIEAYNIATGERIRVTVGADGSFELTIAVSPGDTVELRSISAADNAGEAYLHTYALPPDPGDTAPEDDGDGGFGDDVGFIYQPPDPIQIGLDPDVLDPVQVAVARGRVTDRDGSPLPGVRVAVKDHSEYGYTLTREDGWFDLVINGGGHVVLEYRKGGYLPAQRRVAMRWNDYVVAPDVALVRQAAEAIAIDLGSNEPQMAIGATEVDETGPRQASVFFPPNTRARVFDEQGRLSEVNEVNVRFSEYTVGEFGPQAMPSPLPPNSAYTYAVEISVDEAGGRKVGGRDVVFDEPVALHVDNFMGYPVGGGVPTGYYDNDASAWVAVPDGLIIGVLAVDDGKLVLDLTGDGIPATPGELAEWQIPDSERVLLTQRFEPGDSFWRVPLDHFSTWDCNWPFGPDDDAIPPDSDVNIDDGDEEDPCKEDGCEINAFTQSMSESVDIPGMPGGSIGYDSQYMLGAAGSGPSLDIRLTPADLPQSLKHVVLQVEFLGNRFESLYPPMPNLTTSVPLVLLDPYFRERDGSFPVKVRIGYVYKPVPRGSGGGSGGGFGRPGAGAITGDRERFEVTLWWDWEDKLTLKSAQRSRETMSWRLPFQHVLEVETGTLYLGNGERVSLFDRPEIIRTLAGSEDAGSGVSGDPALGATLDGPAGVAVDAAGKIYIADRGNHRIVVVDRLGNLEVVAGDGTPGHVGDGGPAEDARLNSPSGLTLLPDGRLAVADTGNHRIRIIDGEGVITTLAGTGTAGAGGDGGLATAAQLNAPEDIAADPAGYIYIADTGNERLRVILPGGMIETWSGTGTSRSASRARDLQLIAPTGVAADSEGNVFVVESGEHRIWRLTPEGSVELAAGTGQTEYNGENIPAGEANLTVSAIGLDRSGQLLIADPGNRRIRKVDANGTISTLAGNGNDGFAPDQSVALRAALGWPNGVAVTPDNLVVFSQAHAIRRVARPFPTAAEEEYVVPGPNGERLHVFDQTGRHLATRDALAGSTLYTLQYDGQGRVVSMTDALNNVTTVERDAVGHPTALISPDGLRTEFTLNSRAQLETVTTPAGHVTEFNYDSDGLMVSMTNARGHQWQYEYDDDGRLIADDFPDGGGWTITRRGGGAWWETDFTTRLGRTTTYGMQKLADGSQIRTVTRPDGAQSQVWIGPTGDEVTTLFDGTEVTTVKTPDRRFGVQVLRDAATTVKTPSGLELHVEENVAVLPPTAVAPEEIEVWTETITVNGREYTLEYDQDERTFTRVTPAGRGMVQTVDEQRRPIRTEVPGLAPVTYQYDARGRLSAITQGEGDEQRLHTFAYDSQGYLESVTDPLSRTVTLHNDSDGRPHNVVLPDQREIALDVDANGNVTRLTTPEDNDHAFDYDPLDREIRYEAPQVEAEPTVTESIFDPDGNITTHRVPGNSNLNFDYDAAGRLTSLSRPVLDGDGGNEVELGYQYDGFLVTQETYTGAVEGQVDYHYDNDLRLVGIDVAGTETDYEYDADGLLIESVTDGQSMQLHRDPDNGLLTGTTAGVVEDHWTYSAFGEPTEYHVEIEGEPYFTTEYERDAAGRITTKTETIDGVTTEYSYDYDLAGRLERVWIDGEIDEEYVYDGNGNRLSLHRPDEGTTVAGSYDAQDRMLSYGDCTFDYTPNGELQAKHCPDGTTQYSYSPSGDLTAVVLPDGTQIEYIVDGRGRRLGKRVDGEVVQRFIYRDQLNPVAELDGDGNVLATFTYSENGHVPSTMRKGSTDYRIVTGHLGSVRQVVDLSTGLVVQEKDYDAWGRVIRNTNPGFQPFGFAGGIYDMHTRLVRFGFRDYDVYSGRWTSKDVIGFSSSQFNWYQYAGSDPINDVDASGLIVGKNIMRVLNLITRQPTTAQEIAVQGMVFDTATGFGSNVGDYSSSFDGFAGDAVSGYEIYGGIQSINLGRAVGYTGRGLGAGAGGVALAGMGGFAIGSAVNDIWERRFGVPLGLDIYDRIMRRIDPCYQW